MSEVIQLSVFIANEAGRVSEVTNALGEAGINIRGFSVSRRVGPRARALLPGAARHRRPAAERRPIPGRCA